MKLEVKSVKIAKFASEETLCYEATVYIDGKPKFTARNDGHGGCSMFHRTANGTREDIAAAEAFCASLPNDPSEFFPDEGCPIDLDYAVTTLVTRSQEIRWLKGRLSGKVWGARDDKKLVSWNHKPTPETLVRLSEKFLEITILNDLDAADAYRHMTGDDLPALEGIC